MCCAMWRRRRGNRPRYVAPVDRLSLFDTNHAWPLEGGDNIVVDGYGSLLQAPVAWSRCSPDVTAGCPRLLCGHGPEDHTTVCLLILPHVPLVGAGACPRPRHTAGSGRHSRQPLRPPRRWRRCRRSVNRWRHSTRLWRAAAATCGGVRAHAAAGKQAWGVLHGAAGDRDSAAGCVEGRLCGV